jgi:hypothetical protein
MKTGQDMKFSARKPLVEQMRVSFNKLVKDVRKSDKKEGHFFLTKSDSGDVKVKRRTARLKLGRV